MRRTRRSARGGAIAWALALALAPHGLMATVSLGATAAAATEDEPRVDQRSGTAEPWVERMLGALRLGDTLAARIRAHTVDYARSERDVVIELLRDARGPVMRTLVEVRDAHETHEMRPVVFRIDTFADGSVVSWLWDIRWQQFIKMSGLDGIENFDGTHFHLEDLGFTGLHPRRSGSARELADPDGVVEITSGAYHHYGRVETRIDRESGLPLRTHIYDGTGARIWEIEFAGVESIGGRAVPTRMRTRNPVTRESSTLEWAQVAVGLRIPDEAFDLEKLDAVIRRGGDPIALPERPGATPQGGQAAGEVTGSPARSEPEASAAAGSSEAQLAQP